MLEGKKNNIILLLLGIPSDRRPSVG